MQDGDPEPAKAGTAMLTQEQKTILGNLGYYISFLALALPSRSVPSFYELLAASMITTEGFVTQLWLQGKLRNFWGSYHTITNGWRQGAGEAIKLLPALNNIMLPCHSRFTALISGY